MNMNKKDSVTAMESQALNPGIVKLHENQLIVNNLLGYVGDRGYSLESAVSAIELGLQIGSSSVIAIGSALLAIKENEEYGKFLKVVEDFALDKRTYQNYMKVAFRMLNDEGYVKYKNIAKSQYSKILNLMVLDDEELKELDSGGTVAGLTLETINESSVKEMRKKLKDKSKELDEKNKLLADKNVEIDGYKAKLKELENGPKPAVDWSARSAEILSELNKILMEASQLNGRLNALVDEVHGMQETEWTKEESVCLQQAKFVASTISDDASVTVDRLDWLAPKVNAAFFPGLNFNRGHADEADDADYTVVDGEGEEA